MENKITIPDEYFNVLSQTLLFGSLDKEGLRYALSLFDAEAVQYKKGEFLHYAGSRLTRFGLVLSGKIQVWTVDIEGSKMIMANVTRGGTFGESLCFLKVAQSPCHITAEDNSLVLTLSPDKLYKSDPSARDIEMQKRFTSMIASRTLQMNSRIQVLSKLSIREKLISFFSELVTENGSGTFSVPLSRTDLAAYIGANRSSMTRELAKMKKEGLIDFYKDAFKVPERAKKFTDSEHPKE